MRSVLGEATHARGLPKTRRTRVDCQISEVRLGCAGLRRWSPHPLPRCPAIDPRLSLLRWTSNALATNCGLAPGEHPARPSDVSSQNELVEHFLPRETFVRTPALPSIALLFAATTSRLRTRRRARGYNAGAPSRTLESTGPSLGACAWPLSRHCAPFAFHKVRARCVRAFIVRSDRFAIVLMCVHGLARTVPTGPCDDVINRCQT